MGVFGSSIETLGAIKLRTEIGFDAVGLDFSLAKGYIIVHLRSRAAVLAEVSIFGRFYSAPAGFWNFGI